MYKKITVKVVSNIIIFLVISLIVILLTNIPIDLDFGHDDGKLVSNMDYVKYKEDVVKSSELLVSGEILNYKVYGKGKDVGELVSLSLSRSMRLFSISLLVSLLIGIPKGIFDSRRKNKQSNFKLLQTLLPLSVPDVLTISVVQLLGFYLYRRNVSIFGMEPIMHIGYAHWSQSIYPTIALSLVPSAYIARITASSIERVYDKEYILTARGKGCSETRIILNHTMRNVLTDLIGVFPIVTSIMFSSLFVVERIFYFPGVAFEMLSLYGKPSADGSTTIALLGLAMSIAIIYFVIYTLLEIINQVLSPSLER